VFNSAKRLKKLLERKKEREERLRREAVERGEEVSEEEGDEGGVMGEGSEYKSCHGQSVVFCAGIAFAQCTLRLYSVCRCRSPSHRIYP
jgi:hypothetical protein